MQGRRIKHFTRMAAAIAVCMAAPLALGACSLDTPSQTVSLGQRAELSRSSETARLQTAEMNDAMLMAVAMHYRSSGDGPVHITVTYDPKSKTNTAMKAAGEAARISAFLQRKADVGVISDIQPVAQSGAKSETLITYDVLAAHAPADCSRLGGLDEEQTHINNDYVYGCAIEDQFVRQLANPKDLKGREGLNPHETSGGRFSNIVGGYKTGEAHESLQGYSATE